MVFPNASLALTATANYRGDGSLYNIMAFEVSANGDRAFYGDYYTYTEIEVIGAGGGSFEDVIYEYEPQTSDVQGVAVVAGVFDFRGNDGVALYIASFTINGIAYNIKLHDNDRGESGLHRLTEIVNMIIRNDTADLHVLSDPVIPELRDERLTLGAARTDPDFGAYLPADLPPRYNFESAQRFINQETNSLFAFWDTGGMDSISWHISRPTAHDRELIVSISEHEKYDVSLYPIPWADSVPNEIREYFHSPVFLAQDLTKDAIRARTSWADADSGDTPGWRTSQFGVLYDNVLVEVSMRGLSPEQIWEVFEGLK